MLLRDQGIYVSDWEVADKLDHTPERGANEKNMPYALDQFGSISYVWTPRDSIDDLEEALQEGYSIASSIEQLYGTTQHEVVIDKIEKDSEGDRAFVHIRDNDQRYKVTIGAWEKVWVDGNVVPE